MRTGKRKKYIIGAMSAIFILLCIFPVWSLISKDYLISESDLFKLDSVRLLNRSYWESGGAGNFKTSFSFEDQNGKIFSLGENYSSTNDLKGLNDTLQYSGTVMQIYTDRLGFQNYHNNVPLARIIIYELKIGDRKYLSLGEVNRAEPGKLARMLGVIIVFYLLLLWGYLNELKRKQRMVEP